MEEKRGLGLLDLPLHILSHIFLKLPPSSLPPCAAVCTVFRNIAADPSFRQLFFSQTSLSCLLLSDHRRLSILPPHSPLPPSSSSSSRFAANSSPIGVHTSPDERTGLSSITFIETMNLVNSCHGLLCLSSNFRYHLCNPLSGEFLTLPPPPTPPNRYQCFSALGFDPLRNNYKLLQILPMPNKLVAELYQLGDDTWRVIESPVTGLPRSKSAFDPSLNGAVHWISSSTRVNELICSFDVHTEKFKWVPPPSHFNSEYLNQILGINIGVLKGKLCLCYVSMSVSGAQFETWLMEEYDVEGCWRKAFSIDIHSYCGLSPQDKHSPIGFSSCGDMWLKADSDSDPTNQCLVSYSVQKRAFRHLDIGAIASKYLQATPHVLTYVSLKDIVDLTNKHLHFQIIPPNKH